jgi:hypothetical protein
MRRAKYVVIERDCIESVVIFSDTLSHADIARGLGVGFVGPVLGAGFVQFYTEDGEVLAQTYGRSDSLNIAPRGEDAALLEKEILC